MPTSQSLETHQRVRVKFNAMATGVHCDEASLHVTVADGREISVPLAWFPRLLKASPEQRNHWELIGTGEGVNWPDLDEDIEVESLFRVQ